jgi:hypothetical protein
MWIAWSGRTTGGLVPIYAAAVGPLSLVLGAGVVGHPDRMPRYGMNRLVRVYGVLGGLAGAAYLWLVGSFAPALPGRARWILPVLLVVLWLVPLPAGPRVEANPRHEDP